MEKSFFSFKQIFPLNKCINRFVSSTKKLKLPCKTIKKEIKKILALCIKKSCVGIGFVEITQTRGISPTFNKNLRKFIFKLTTFEVFFS